MQGLVPLHDRAKEMDTHASRVTKGAGSCAVNKILKLGHVGISPCYIMPLAVFVWCFDRQRPTQCAVNIMRRQSETRHSGKLPLVASRRLGFRPMFIDPWAINRSPGQDNLCAQLAAYPGVQVIHRLFVRHPKCAEELVVWIHSKQPTPMRKLGLTQ